MEEPEKSEIGKNRFENGMQTFIGAAAFRFFHHQKLIVRLLLNLNEVRHLRYFGDIAKIFADTLAAIEGCGLSRGLGHRRS
jgi:hypothetical protein